ncbi:hypothetical protein [Vibrio phage vB_VmeM-Yong XC32]|nr:hypothetical protein [Vibrio phage vB_VmeM-Yong XC31]QAX96524.1 hypothetical protein [Vibrio phage vB_VmeM-Yong XC32]QAX96842.1 hypothetical protein [Vibrio phage vB_VmeM-Yong MS31]QAX97147.1 hypothetical protein [Vibrio phage vB_VmeM-Yong MS32]
MDKFTYDMLEVALDFRTLAIMQSKGLIPVTDKNIDLANVFLGPILGQAEAPFLFFNKAGKELWFRERAYHFMESSNCYVYTRHSVRYYFNDEGHLLHIRDSNDDIFTVTREERATGGHRTTLKTANGKVNVVSCFDEKGRLMQQSNLAEDFEITYHGHANDGILKEVYYCRGNGIDRFKAVEGEWLWSAVCPSSVTVIGFTKDQPKVHCESIELH